MKAIDRVSEYIDYKGLNNSSFEKKNDLSNGYIGKQLKRSADLGESILNKILENCPELNPEWLLTGRGNMLKNDNENKDSGIIIHRGNRKTRDAIHETQDVPLYDIEATAGLQSLFKSGKTANILDNIRIPNIPSCDGAISITGDSMYPLLKSGDIVMYKEIPVDLQSIFFGEMYLLGVMVDEFEEMITVKYVQKSDLEGHVKLVSQNQHHQPKDVPLNRITAMAMVKVSIRKNTMF
ncbi:S24 family peptidase [Riemerella anatipestifer]|uniref:S24 family peptidase n=1 Tax=Riemerella anatipestifer TaxID=34085 RepID=UPI0012AE6410|nr:S24 family peptidase [Riemerella anatipestifer]MCQ4155108.1 S24 family peptidase [Riemerella anatipestifer]MCQ4181080.1 S24 family peptidase [Riemerella anatipestifer]MCU7542950.1 S24 family peptidase [Riemerella anatipestifer]MCU7560037.1 S24 family peptidase [Riemerella anatipestifer]MCW0513691.1 S24 family peptidase [Riemerella anatipestifer]